MNGIVPFVSLDRVHAPIGTELHAAFARVVGASAFILGEEVERFEREWAAVCGTRECVGVASGTAALTLLLQAAGIRTGDEVVVPAHTYIATALAVIHAGAVPVLCDVDAGTGLIDPEAAEDAIGPNTTAILAVHLYGQLCAMDELRRLASRHGLALFEDAAQAHGARWRRRRAGAFGEGAAFSFYPSKNLGALGDGGAVCTSDARLAARVRRLRNLGQRRKGEHVVPGVNERLDGLQAALLSVKLRGLDAANRARRRHAAAYRLRLDGRVGLLEQRPESPCVYHLFPIRVPERDTVAARMWAAGVETGVHYSPALHEQPALEGRVIIAHPLPRAEAWAAEELSLPMSPALRADEVRRAADACIQAIDALAHAGSGRFRRSLSHA